MLTQDEIREILDRLSWRVVVEKRADFPYRVVQDGSGYSDDPDTSRLQAKLSIMLEVAGRMGR